MLTTDRYTAAKLARIEQKKQVSELDREAKFYDRLSERVLLAGAVVVIVISIICL